MKFTIGLHLFYFYILILRWREKIHKVSHTFNLENDKEIVLAKFIMTYLTTILSEAIKWKQKD